MADFRTIKDFQYLLIVAAAMIALYLFVSLLIEDYRIAAYFIASTILILVAQIVLGTLKTKDSGEKLDVAEKIGKQNLNEIRRHHWW